MTEKDLLATSTKGDTKKTSKLGEAEKAILDLFKDGDILVKEAEKILKDKDISHSTFRRARKELKLESYPKGFGKEKKSYLKKPETEDKI